MKGKGMAYIGDEKLRERLVRTLTDASTQSDALRGGRRTGVECGSCGGDRKTVDQVGDRLDRLAFTLRHTYQTDLVFLCRECGQLWLHQYWEVFHDDDPWAEWGDRHWVDSPLTTADVGLICAALASGECLPHDRFMA